MRALVALALVSLSCGETDGERVAWCKDFVTEVNQLDCNREPLDEAAWCPVDSDDTDCDVETYYECVRAGYRCEGDELVIEVTDCHLEC